MRDAESYTCIGFFPLFLQRNENTKFEVSKNLPRAKTRPFAFMGRNRGMTFQPDQFLNAAQRRARQVLVLMQGNK